MTTFKPSTDTYADHNQASKVLKTQARLWIRADTTNVGKRIYLGFHRPFPLGVNIISATLSLYRSGAWTGTHTVSATQIVTPWSDATLNWNNQPTIDSSHIVTVNANAGADKSVVQWDLTAMMQAVSNGSKFMGIRLAKNEDTATQFRSLEDPDTTLRPTLDIVWTYAPLIPDGLVPTGGDSVSVASPIFRWGYQDADSQSAYQLQISSNGSTADVLDTGKVLSSDHFYDSSTGSFTIAAAATRYWRVQVWDATDKVSGYTAWQTFTRTNLSSLTLNSPGSTTDDLTPNVAWTFGGTQVRWKVTLEEQDSKGKWKSPPKQLTQGTDSTTVVRILDSNALKSNGTYRVTVQVWDSVTRSQGEAATVQQVFTYARSGAPAAVTSLTATRDPNNSPGVVLAWSRSAAPDFWALKVDGVVVLPRIDVNDTHISGTNYGFTYWAPKPRVQHTYEIEAVVQSGGAAFQHSSGNQTKTLTTNPIGVWLADAYTDIINPISIQIVGNDEPSIGIGEDGTTYFPVGAQAPVRITSNIRGYEGNHAGLLQSVADVATFHTMKNRDTQLTLVMGDLVIPVRLEAVADSPTNIPGDQLWHVSFSFFQVDEPWPVQ